jgi:hypothetical protein
LGGTNEFRENIYTEALFELASGGKAASQPKTPAQQPLVVGLRVKDMATAMAELQAKGIVFTETGQVDETRWAHFSDPEGNQLEIKGGPGNLNPGVVNPRSEDGKPQPQDRAACLRVDFDPGYLTAAFCRPGAGDYP